MKRKRIILLAILMIVGLTSNLKAQLFDEYSQSVSIGYGFPNLKNPFFRKYKNYTDYQYKSRGPYFFKIEVPLNGRMGLGLDIDYSDGVMQYNYDNLFHATWTIASIGFLARFNYHFFDSEDFDPYLGGGLGYRMYDITYYDNDLNSVNEAFIPTLSPITFEVTAGVRYFFMDHFALYLEAGYAKAPIQGGFVYKF